MRAHKGAIKIYSEPGNGTTFYVLLPASTAKAAREPEPPTSPVIVQESKTVLVIDDEEIVRSAATSALRRLGYEVLSAYDGSQGVQVFRSLHTSISLVILDLSMPGISGEETLQQLRTINPDTPILLFSGFSEPKLHAGLAIPVWPVFCRSRIRSDTWPATQRGKQHQRQHSGTGGLKISLRLLQADLVIEPADHHQSLEDCKLPNRNLPIIVDARTLGGAETLFATSIRPVTKHRSEEQQQEYDHGFVQQC